MPKIFDRGENNYKRWAITQRINELKKTLKRIQEKSSYCLKSSKDYYKQRQEELENLQKDLDES